MPRDSTGSGQTPEPDEPAHSCPHGLDVEAYLRRIGVQPPIATTANPDTLARLQRAHVTAVPFENLSIVGDPHGAWNGERVELSVPHLYEKIVERGRGGYCFELNGLFHCLLDAVGYDVDRIAGRVTGEDGSARPPANHHVNVVELNRRYVVDVGTGAPMPRQPLPLDGTVQTDKLGVAWRVAESDRPDAEYSVQLRTPDTDTWETRYVFTDIPRELHYFAATNDYLQSAPKSPFTGGPTVTTATEDGHLKLSANTLTEWSGTDEQERPVSEAAWHDVLADSFGLEIPE